MFEVEKWIDGLNLQFKIKNPQRDLANGMAIAQVVSAFKPGLIGPQCLQNAMSIEKRTENWEFLTQKLTKIDFPFPRNYNTVKSDIINQKLTNSGQEFLISLYEFFTGQQLQKITYAHEKPKERKQQTQHKAKTEVPESENGLSMKQTRQQQQTNYTESFNHHKPQIIDVFKEIYKTTFLQLQKQSMYDVFTALGKIEEAFEEVDEELTKQSTVLTMPPQCENVYQFFENCLNMPNIGLNSANDLVCQIFFHLQFIINLEDNLSSVVESVCCNLQSQFNAFFKMLNIYYNSQNDLIYMKQKDLTHLFMDSLLQSMAELNKGGSQYLQILIHNVLIQLPQDFHYISEQFIQKHVLLEKQMMTHVLNDGFYDQEFYFLKQRSQTLTVRYLNKNQSAMSQTSFICTILSKILIRHPLVCIQLINSYVMQQMRVSNLHTLNTASKEFIDRIDESDNCNVTIIERQATKQMNKIQLLFMMLLAEQYTYTFEYTHQQTADIIEICKFFFYYALQLDILKTDNRILQPLIHNYLEKRKSMAVMYFNIISQLYLLISLDTQKAIDTENADMIKQYIQEFGQNNNSKLSIIYKGVQIITHYITGVIVKYFSNNNKNTQQLQEVIQNFVMSERSDNLQAIITATAQMCEHLYGTIMSFVDMVQFVYQSQLSSEQIQRYLTVLPSQTVKAVDQTFITAFNIIQQLTRVTKELLEILECINTGCKDLRKTEGYQLIDMDLEEEPLFSCMTELHKQLKKLF